MRLTTYPWINESRAGAQCSARTTSDWYAGPGTGRGTACYGKVFRFPYGVDYAHLYGVPVMAFSR